MTPCFCCSLCSVSLPSGDRPVRACCSTPAGGSTVLIRVLSHLSAGAASEGGGAAAAMGTAGGGDDARHVLVAEDEPLLLQHLCHARDIAGYLAGSIVSGSSKMLTMAITMCNALVRCKRWLLHDSPVGNRLQSCVARLEGARALGALLRRRGSALAAEPALHGRLQHALLPRQPPAQQQMLREQLLLISKTSCELHIIYETVSCEKQTFKPAKATRGFEPSSSRCSWISSCAAQRFEHGKGSSTELCIPAILHKT